MFSRFSCRTAECKGYRGSFTSVVGRRQMQEELTGKELKSEKEKSKTNWKLLHDSTSTHSLYNSNNVSGKKIVTTDPSSLYVSSEEWRKSQSIPYVRSSTSSSISSTKAPSSSSTSQEKKANSHSSKIYEHYQVPVSSCPSLPLEQVGIVYRVSVFTLWHILHFLLSKQSNAGDIYGNVPPDPPPRPTTLFKVHEMSHSFSSVENPQEASKNALRYTPFSKESSLKASYGRLD